MDILSGPPHLSVGWPSSEKPESLFAERTGYLSGIWNFLMLGMIADKIQSSFGFSTD